MGGRFGELLLLIILALLLFGPNKLPDLARAVGQALREFKKAANTDPVENASPAPAPAAPAAQASSVVSEPKSSRKKKSSVVS